MQPGARKAEAEDAPAAKRKPAPPAKKPLRGSLVVKAAPAPAAAVTTAPSALALLGDYGSGSESGGDT